MIRARGVKTGIGALVVLLVMGAAATAVLPSGENPVKSHPAPPPYPSAAVASLAQELAAQKPVADRAFRSWSAAHPAQDDAAFTDFVLAQLPAPPTAAVQDRELAELRRVAATRTSSGLDAARWFEIYGKKDAWKLYVRDATEFRAPTERKAAKAALKADTKLAKAITAKAQASSGRQAPSVVDPTLRPGAARKAKLSYPSKHTVYVFSELALLSALDPGRTDDFQSLADQVAYSRLYSAGHYRSDLVAGALVGDLLGDYELRGLDLPNGADVRAARADAPA